MSDPFVAEIRIFAGNFAPKNWAMCNGQILPISQNTALFSLLGTFYGGNGFNTFALPDLRGRAPMDAGFGSNRTDHYPGDNGGNQTVTLTTDNLPPHSHAITASGSSALSNDPAGKTLAVPYSGDNLYAPAPAQGTPLSGFGATGGGQPHNNMQPYLALNFIICIYGIFPPRQ